MVNGATRATIRILTGRKDLIVTKKVRFESENDRRLESRVKRG